MKTKLHTHLTGYLLIVMLIASAGLLFAQGATEETHGIPQSSQREKPEFTVPPVLESGTKEDLSTAEIEGLILMREEEKLARDVYDALGQVWGFPVFSNIARSEQTHMDAVKLLLDTYGLDDPIDQDIPGEFSNPELQELYHTLVDQGSVSLLEALKIGALIEDLDIKDLSDLMEGTQQEDILQTYANLKKGSENHMRSFNNQLSRYGETYSATYISDEELQNILND